MLPLDIQVKMGVIFEQLKTIEVELQKAEADLLKAASQEETCKDGVEEVKSRVKAAKEGNIVFIEQVKAVQKTLDTVVRFYDQSAGHSKALKRVVAALKRQRDALQDEYKALDLRLTKACDNIVVFGK